MTPVNRPAIMKARGAFGPASLITVPGVRKIPAPVIPLIPSMTTLQKPSLLIARAPIRGSPAAGLFRTCVSYLSRQSRCELGGLCGAVEGEQRGGGAVTVIVVPHQDWNAVVAYRIERVLIGDVVAEINGHQGS